MITIENTVEYNEEERAYYIDGNDNISFMEIHEYEDEDERGYDYTYFRSDYTEYDGGQLDNPEYTMNQAVEELLGDEDIDCDQITPIDHDILLEATNEANNIIYYSRATKKEIDRMLLESSKKYDDMLFGNQSKEDTKIFEIFCQIYRKPFWSINFFTFEIFNDLVPGFFVFAGFHEYSIKRVSNLESSSLIFISRV